jgi:glycosyltransferase involved in cell wall biosynthesis
VNGLILENPADSATLAGMMRQLADDPAFASRIAAKGAETARQVTWERNVDDVRAIFAQVLARDDRTPAHEAASHADPGRSAASK